MVSAHPYAVNLVSLVSNSGQPSHPLRTIRFLPRFPITLGIDCGCAARETFLIKTIIGAKHIYMKGK